MYDNKQRGPHGAPSATCNRFGWLFLLRLILLPVFVSCASLCTASPPARFVSRGPGGGGAFFAPSINPYNADDLWIGSDMSDLFHSTDFGRNWDTVDFRVLQGGSLPGRMEFTSHPLVRY